MARSSATAVVPQLRRLLGREGVLSDPADLVVYDCDGLTIEKRRPEAVVFPTTTEATAEVVRLCNRHEIPLVVRGAGTSLAGGCVPIGGGLVVSLTRMRRILEISLRDRMAV
ncbi:MAG: FAD-binding oxidoreductase, partial [Pirellulales bacterium]|nr:FAD-binding oxidoreductase [Pirellulales bacterium]